MNLKGIREEAGRTQLEVIADARTHGLDKRIDVSDIYAEKDVDFGILRPQKARQRDRRAECYKLTIRHYDSAG